MGAPRFPAEDVLVRTPRTLRDHFLGAGIALRKTTRDERGQALVIGIVLIAALSISTAAIVGYVTSGQTIFGRDRTSMRVFDVAEAGLNAGLSVAATQDPNNLASGSLPSAGTYSLSLDGMTARYSATKTGSQWLVTSTATSPNGKVTRKLQQILNWNTSTQQIDESQVYTNGLYVAGTNGCTTIHGTVTMQASIWVNNNLCLVGGVNLVSATPHTYTVYVKGQYQGRNNTAIGSAASPFANATIIGGCVVQNNPVVCSTASASNVYADAYPSTPSTQIKPDIDPPGTYASGDWSHPTCTGAGFTFDNNTAMDQSVGSVNLFSGGSFNCMVTDSTGNFIGGLTWNNSTKVLTINGLVFIDGNVNISNSATYAGSGAIYVNGVINKSSNITVCGPGAPPALGSCPTTWNPSSGQLGFVVLNPLQAATGVDCTGNGQLDFVLYVVQGFANTGGTTITGAVIADAADIGGNTGLVVSSTPPPYMPITHTVTTGSWGVLPGSWKQLG